MALSTNTFFTVAGTRTMKQRIADIIRQYDAQGIHRTGTAPDNLSAEWLLNEITALGVEGNLDSFKFKRVQVHKASLEFGDIEIQGVPLYDCTYTTAAGLSGSLGEIGSDADIGVAMTLPYEGGPTYAPIDKARKAGSHKAIVMVTDERLPAGGVSTLNAERFTDPFGPPVLQVPNDHWGALQLAMKNRSPTKLIAHCDYVDAVAHNVQARIKGSDPSLAPLVVMTPRSGWWNCASERGGGIAAFIEIMRAVNSAGARRDVIFTANTGHELGHTGLDHYLHANPDLIGAAQLWIHLGANIAASQGAGIRLQFSDEQARGIMMKGAGEIGIQPSAETPLGDRPLGEARNVFDGGGRYISILGSNGLFHHPADRWPDAVDLETTTSWCSVLTKVAVALTTQMG